MSAATTRNVAILLFDGVEILDFAGPYEALYSVDVKGQTAFNVFTVAPENRLITSAGNLLIKPHHTIDDHPPIDILVVPGGDVRGARADERLRGWIARHDASADIVASVCTGAFVLGDAGVLSGLRATTHWGSIERLRVTYSDVEVVDDQRVIDTGHVVTAAGVSAGIDMALHLIERLHGRDVAEQTARYMEYEWRAPEHAGA